jgi:hypothetical protein
MVSDEVCELTMAAKKALSRLQMQRPVPPEAEELQNALAGYGESVPDVSSGSNAVVVLPLETLQRLIDYAHAAMGKRPDYSDELTISISRSPNGHAPILAKDLRAIQTLGKPSWETDL